MIGREATLLFVVLLDEDDGAQVVQDWRRVVVVVHAVHLQGGYDLVRCEGERLLVIFVDVDVALLCARRVAHLKDLRHVGVEDEEEEHDGDQAAASAERRPVNALLVEVQRDWHAELIPLSN